eukprot:scaffold396071_cov17-Prasinocladus_malaysianus.AAC.1
MQCFIVNLPLSTTGVQLKMHVNRWPPSFNMLSIYEKLTSHRFIKTIVLIRFKFVQYEVGVLRLGGCQLCISHDNRTHPKLHAGWMTGLTYCGSCAYHLQLLITKCVALKSFTDMQQQIVEHSIL